MPYCASSHRAEANFIVAATACWANLLHAAANTQNRPRRAIAGRNFRCRPTLTNQVCKMHLDTDTNLQRVSAASFASTHQLR